MIFVCIVFIGGEIGETEQTTPNINIDTAGFSPEVLKHKSMVEKYAAECKISDYVVYLLAIMQVESGGTAVDVMQSSESLGLPPNSLTTEESIKQGCYYFSTLLIAAEMGNCDIHTVIQAYNYGAGFVQYVAERGSVYSFALSMGFAEERSGGKKVDYRNPIAIEINGGWRYGYGNMFYVHLVSQYLETEGDFAWPTNSGNIITSVYGNRIHPVTGRNDNHTGTDIAAPFGTEVFSIANGTVVTTGYDTGGYGNYVVIEHSGGYQSLYAHLSQRKVSEGTTVLKGQVIGLCGSTGNSTGPHIHLEVKLNGERIDPLTLYSESLYRYS